MTTTNIVWAWGTNTHIKFNPATDILNFGWFAADQFTISEVNGSVVIAIPSNHQTYTLDNVTLSELHLSDIVAKDTSAISEWQSVLSTTTTPPPESRLEEHLRVYHRLLAESQQHSIQTIGVSSHARKRTLRR